MRSIRRLTDAEREQRREQDRQRLHEAANRLLTSEGWRRWVGVRARGGLARLSLNNQLLIALSCPDATFVAGFKAWLALGYCVRKGEKAIRIIAPMPINTRRDDDLDDSAAGDVRPRVLFKAVPVFDRSQVAPRAGVEQMPLEPVSPGEPILEFVERQPTLEEWREQYEMTERLRGRIDELQGHFERGPWHAWWIALRRKCRNTDKPIPGWGNNPEFMHRLRAGEIRFESVGQAETRRRGGSESGLDPWPDDPAAGAVRVDR